jgi:hypothetical protein
MRIMHAKERIDVRGRVKVKVSQSVTDAGRRPAKKAEALQEASGRQARTVSENFPPLAAQAGKLSFDCSSGDDNNNM